MEMYLSSQPETGMLTISIGVVVPAVGGRLQSGTQVATVSLPCSTVWVTRLL